MSNKKLARILGGCIAVFVAVVAIAALDPKAPEPATDYSTLLRYLSDSGASIVEKGEIQQSFLEVEGEIVTVSGGAIQVFEYANAEAMESEARCVSSDGFTIMKEKGDIGVGYHISWISAPHFYKAGRVVVIYIGEDDSITNLLENALGAQFAGM